jgi:hypothetical protein
MKNTFSIMLLETNLKYHKEQIKNLSRPIASNNEYIQIRLKEHIECKTDIQDAILKLKNL